MLKYFSETPFVHKTISESLTIEKNKVIITVKVLGWSFFQDLLNCCHFNIYDMETLKYPLKVNGERTQDVITSAEINLISTSVLL